MTQLSHLAKLGIAREVTPNVYVPPTMWVPYTKAEFEDHYAPIKDTSVRGNDTVLQGVYQGEVHATWGIDLHAYPDFLGHVLRCIIGPDTVTAGAATTLSGATAAGATAIITPVSLPAGTTVAIDSGAMIEFAITDGAATGAGPYTSNVTTRAGATGASRVGLVAPHASGATVQAASTHTFRQSIDTTTKPTYSFLVWDTTQWISYSGAACSEVQIKLDPKASVTLSTKFTSLAGVNAASAVATYGQSEPLLGWEWSHLQNGALSTRGLSLDANLKRAVTVINSSDGVQGPREIFQGAFEIDGSYKAIYEGAQYDLNLYTNNIQQPVVAQVVQPLAKGGAQLTLSASKTAFTTGKRDMGTEYVEASYALSGVFNVTDGGACSATLTNFVTSAY